jgi:hypothetical protein
LLKPFSEGNWDPKPSNLEVFSWMVKQTLIYSFRWEFRYVSNLFSDIFGEFSENSPPFEPPSAPLKGSPPHPAVATCGFLQPSKNSSLLIGSLGEIPTSQASEATRFLGQLGTITPKMVVVNDCNGKIWKKLLGFRPSKWGGTLIANKPKWLILWAISYRQAPRAQLGIPNH